jgi:hypothetical protein
MEVEVTDDDGDSGCLLCFACGNYLGFIAVLDNGKGNAKSGEWLRATLYLRPNAW